MGYPTAEDYIAKAQEKLDSPGRGLFSTEENILQYLSIARDNSVSSSKNDPSDQIRDISRRVYDRLAETALTRESRPKNHPDHHGNHIEYDTKNNKGHWYVNSKSRDLLRLTRVAAGMAGLLYSDDDAVFRHQYFDHVTNNFVDDVQDTLGKVVFRNSNGATTKLESGLTNVLDAGGLRERALPELKRLEREAGVDDSSLYCSSIKKFYDVARGETNRYQNMIKTSRSTSKVENIFDSQRALFDLSDLCQEECQLVDQTNHHRWKQRKARELSRAVVDALMDDSLFGPQKYNGRNERLNAVAKFMEEHNIKPFDSYTQARHTFFAEGVLTMKTKIDEDKRGSFNNIVEILELAGDYFGAIGIENVTDENREVISESLSYFDDKTIEKIENGRKKLSDTFETMRTIANPGN